MSIHVPGNLYRTRIAFEDDPTQSKTRPVVLIDILGEDQDSGLVTEITRTEPKDPPTYHDQFKEPINKWQEANLKTLSYAKTHKNFIIPINVLRKPIGRMNEEEFLRIASKVIEYINGDEEKIIAQ